MASDVIRLNNETVEQLENFRKLLSEASPVEAPIYKDLTYVKLIRIALLYAEDRVRFQGNSFI